MVMKLYANIDNKIWVAKPMFNSVAGVVLVEINDATMARIANGNKQRNKFSRGLRTPVSYTHLTLPTICSV